MKLRVTAWLILIAGMLICRGIYVDDHFYNVDEAEYAVAADALKEGLLPGVDLLGSTKPPGIVTLYALLFEILGRSLLVIHIAQIVLMILTGAVVIEIAILLWGMQAAIPAAVLFWMTANSFSLPSEILALNVEIPGTLLAIAAIWTALFARRTGWLATGLLLGLAALFRPGLLAFLLPVLVLLWRSDERRISGSFLTLGLLLPWITTAVIYAQAGGLSWAMDSWFRYPVDYARDVGVIGFFSAMAVNLFEFATQAWVPLLAAAGGKLIAIREWPHRRTGLILSLALASFVALCVGSRFYGHYFIQVFPAVALAGVPAWLFFREESGRQIVLTILLVVGSVIAVIHFPLWRYWDSEAPSAGISPASLTVDELEIEIASFVKEHTSPEDRITVWGYCPQIYFLSQRLPGTRDYLCHYTTGFSAGSFDPQLSRAFREHGYPRADEMFIEDLQRNQPAFIIDLSEINDYEYTFYHFPINHYPQLARYIREHYSPRTAIGHAAIYGRTP